MSGPPIVELWEVTVWEATVSGLPIFELAPNSPELQSGGLRSLGSYSLATVFGADSTLNRLAAYSF